MADSLGEEGCAVGRWSRLFRRGAAKPSCPRRFLHPPLPRGLLHPHSSGPAPPPPASTGALSRVPWPVHLSCMYCLPSVLLSGSLSSGGAPGGCWPPAAPTAPPPAGRAPWRSWRLLRTSARAGPPADAEPTSLPAALGEARQGEVSAWARGPGPGTCTLRTRVHSPFSEKDMGPSHTEERLNA